MSSINNVGNAAGSSPIQKIIANPIQKQTAAAASSPVPSRDRLELSGMSHLLKSLKSNEGVRTDKVASIKSQIEAGTYEDDAKLNTAIDRLLDDLTK